MLRILAELVKVGKFFKIKIISFQLVSFCFCCKEMKYGLCSIVSGLYRPYFIVSPDESRRYLGFSMVTPPQRFTFGRDNLKKNILVRTFKFGMWVYMGNATNAIVL